MTGYLEITYGPMFSGKTSKLINNANKYIDKNKQQGKNRKVLVINHTSDTRKEGLSPHTKQELNPEITIKKINYLNSINFFDYDYIAIDEAQFFINLHSFIRKALKHGKHIHCSGLIADSNKEKFGELTSIFYLADTVQQLKAFCYICGDKEENAPFTKCLIKKSEQVLIGDKQEYRPVCGNHF